MGREIHFTGVSKDELDADFKKMNKGEKVPRKCYMCKREEGISSVAIEGKNSGKYLLGKVELRDIIVFSQGSEFSYKLCVECYMLIKHINDVTGQTQFFRREFLTK